jgi:hypothetical protein
MSLHLTAFSRIVVTIGVCCCFLLSNNKLLLLLPCTLTTGGDCEICDAHNLQRIGGYRPPGRNTMSSHIMSYVKAVAVALCATVATGANWAVASEDCLAQPSRQLGQGGHWYYRLDHVDKRKCWYLEGPGATPRDAGATVGGCPLTLPRFPPFSPCLLRISGGQKRAKHNKVLRVRTPTTYIALRKTVEVAIPE